jgi:hypothetical protein
MAISETVIILAGGIAVVAILFAIRRAMVVSAGTGKPAPSGGTGAPDVAGVVALLGSTLVYLGLAITAGSLWAIVLIVPMLWVINVGVVAREERYEIRRSIPDVQGT